MYQSKFSSSLRFCILRYSNVAIRDASFATCTVQAKVWPSNCLYWDAVVTNTATFGFDRQLHVQVAYMFLRAKEKVFCVHAHTCSISSMPAGAGLAESWSRALSIAAKSSDHSHYGAILHCFQAHFVFATCCDVARFVNHMAHTSALGFLLSIWHAVAEAVHSSGLRCRLSESQSSLCCGSHATLLRMVQQLSRCLLARVNF